MSKDAMTVAEKWAARTKASTAAYVAGVNAVTESPTAKAAAAAPKYAAATAEAVTSGRYARSLQSVSLQQWQQAAAVTGAARLSSGVDKGKGKMTDFLTKFLPFQADLSRAVRAMPSDTPEQREERALAMMRGTRRFSRK